MTIFAKYQNRWSLSCQPDTKHQHPTPLYGTTDDRKNLSMAVYLDKSGDTDVIFNDKGKNIAIVGQDPEATYTDADLRDGVGEISGDDGTTSSIYGIPPSSSSI